MAQPTDYAFRLIVPLDASGIEGADPREQALRVVAVRGEEIVGSQIARLDGSGRGEVVFGFEGRPGELRVLIGPESAADEDLPRLQTIAASVSARAWLEPGEVRLEPLRVPPFYWFWWLRWCRTFTVRGRVVCPDGNPVPGADVCAFDVDWWWWWAGIQQVGCATTDINGAFEITFRWCCGWWPWWWWHLRNWRLEPFLVQRVAELLPANTLRTLPVPNAQPSLGVFDQLLATDGILQQEPAASVDPGRLDRLRKRLVERFPINPDAALRIWPWWPWWPWWDCTPDIIFRVTQNCRGTEMVILNEGYVDTRWNIPSLLDVTLVTSDEACCVPRPPGCEEGDCIVISQICTDLVARVGGNLGAPAAPAGYRDPGVAATHGDRPYGGDIGLSGECGNQMDYYEFEWSDNSGATWQDMPPAAAGSVSRIYFDSALLPGSPWVSVPVPFTLIDGRWVAESKAHYEGTHDPLTWGVSRVWVGNAGILMNWRTEGNFADGTYHLRLRAWDRPGANIESSRILPLCGTKEQENRVVITVDNRFVGPPHPHPCDGGTVHTCTTEPDTDFIAVRINGGPVEACDVVDAAQGGTLEIDFLAHDPDEHLAYYTIVAIYGENQQIDLLGLASATITPLTAAQVGPTYGDARSTQGAVAPTWAGGTYRLTITNLSEVFPVTCCYALDLRAYKRTIVNCNNSFEGHANRSTYTLTVTV
jgi:hypothetical protein